MIIQDWPWWSLLVSITIIQFIQCPDIHKSSRDSLIWGWRNMAGDSLSLVLGRAGTSLKQWRRWSADVLPRLFTKALKDQIEVVI